ncbi:peptide chain release factor N(5)-glutamine methyltransferase [Flavobacterium sp. I3-2]|uniref:peptide chain release factor N(5)-glutamine methyltransferase n=1 Tax=Flavobacterium sp. I3-2 TaxID=2748319 RepID=UPI0015AB4FDE|nr:peptide chain release factor N(5)-glutamine methyltransferase [Flavobacterium sp. I3-2]
MELKSFKNEFTSSLSKIYDSAEAEQLFFIALEEILDWKRIDFVMKTPFELPIDKASQFENVLADLVSEKPIQYIFNKAYFYGLDFYVNENTLIPRQETEELVEWILNTIAKNPTKIWRILDIGTGSGCIPITIAKIAKNVNVSTMDISVKAIEVAKQNALVNNVTIHFIHQSILETDFLENYDLIVSNPPYVRNLEKIEIKNNVLVHEPHLALFVQDDDPLIFYKKIVALAENSLTENGYLFFEINQYLGKETLELFNEHFSDIELRKDFVGNDRMICGIKK